MLHSGLQKAGTTGLFSNLSADGGSGGKTFPVTGAYSHNRRCCYGGSVDNLVKGGFVGL